jgi:capsular polysaccharide biosynthesis protein
MALQARGFLVIRPELVSPERQFMEFSRARCLVAAHGAALTSLIAANPPCSVLELFNPNKGTQVYFRIADAVGISYQAIAGDEVDKISNAWLAPIEHIMAAV